MSEKKNKRLTKTQLSVTLLLILFISITGTTFAYYNITASNNTAFTGNMATINLSLNVEKVFPTNSSNNTNVMIPQLSNDAALSSALKAGCVDGNTNVACQVYKIEIKNNGGGATEIVDGKISFYSNPTMTTAINSKMPNLKWRQISTANAETSESSVLGNGSIHNATGIDETFVSNVQMYQNATYTYYIIIWINETNSDQIDKSSSEEEKTFYGKISFDSSNGTGITAAFQS